MAIEYALSSSICRQPYFAVICRKQEIDQIKPYFAALWTKKLLVKMSNNVCLTCKTPVGYDKCWFEIQNAIWKIVRLSDKHSDLVFWAKIMIYDIILIFNLIYLISN